MSTRWPEQTRWPEPTIEDAAHFMGTTPPPQHADVMPLWCFDTAKRAQIEAAVLAPDPPPRWIHVGFSMMESRAWYEWCWYRGIDPDKRRRTIPQSVRAAVIKRDGYVCRICTADVEQDDVHLDHIIPFSRGGPDTVDNLRVTHARCNLRRGNREDDELWPG